MCVCVCLCVSVSHSRETDRLAPVHQFSPSRMYSGLTVRCHALRLSLYLSEYQTWGQILFHGISNMFAGID